MKTVLVFLTGIVVLSANGPALAQEPNPQKAAFEVAHSPALSPVNIGDTGELQEGILIDRNTAPSPGTLSNETMLFTDGAGACGFDNEFGTQAQADCGNILDALKQTYAISWEAPTDPAIRLYDFSNRGLRRWKLADAQALRDALDAWSQALGGVDAAKPQLGLENLTFKLRGQRYMLIPGDLGEYIDAWNEIDLGSLSIQAVDFAHELAHRWERHHGDAIYGQMPTYRTLQFMLKFYKGYDSKTDIWTSDDGGWTDIARGTEGHYNGARPEEDFAETASHVVMQTQIVQQYKNSERYQLMVSLMPGLQHP